MDKNKTNYYMTFQFDYEGEKQTYDWNMSFKAVCQAIRIFCKKDSADIEATDGALWNLIVVDLKADLEDILEDPVVVSEIQKQFQADIMEEFKDEWDYDHEGE
jgi:hypothetical protein